MNKELKFSMKFDTGDFDRAVERMQQKLKEIAGLAKGAPGGQQGGGPGAGAGGIGASGPMMPQFLKNMDDLRKSQSVAMQNHSKEQMKFAKDIYKEEERRSQLMTAQEKSAKNKNKDLAEELRIKKDLKNTEEQISRLQKEAGRSQATFDASRGAQAGGTQPVFVVNAEDFPGGGNNRGGRGGGGPGGGGSGGRGGGFMGSLGKSLGFAAAALGAVGAVIDQYTQLPITRNVATGNMTQSILGNQVQELSQGNVVQGMAWNKERAEALDIARERMMGQMVSSPLKVVQGAAGMVKGGFGGGFDESSNYLSGALTKGLEKVFSVGGLVPNRISSSLGKASEEYFSTQQAQIMEDFGKNYESIVEAKKKQDPLKGLAAQYLQDRFQSDLASERMMGTNDQQFYGRKGFLEQANTSGFTGDMRMQTAQGIQGAGGSTRAMSGNASLLALQAARGYDLTNSASVLGTISGGAGDSASSERIFKRIIEEGTRNGLDRSDAVEELRRYTQQTAEVVAKTGATGASDVQRIIENFSAFQKQGELPTTREQEGAKAAYQEYQGQTAETAGRGGAMQFASLTKTLGSKAAVIGAKGLGMLMEMPEEDITADNERVIAMAVKAKMSPEELAQKIIESKQRAVEVGSGFNGQDIQARLKKAGVTGKLSAQQLSALPEDAQQAYEEAITSSSVQGKYENTQKAEARANRFIRGGVSEPTSTALTPEQQKAEDDRFAKGKPGERGADEVIRAQGVAAQAFLENFRQFKDVVTPAADAVDALTKKMIIFMQVMQMTPDKDKAATGAGVGGMMAEDLRRQAQSHASKPPPGGTR